MEIILNAEKLKDKEEAHEYLKEMLNLPEYYGRNLDALSDCLTDYDEELKITILNYQKTDSYGTKILNVLRHTDIEVELR